MTKGSENECCSSSLDIFSPPMNQVAVENYFMTEVLPLHPLSDANSQITFSVPLSEEFTDLDDSYFEIQVQILKNDGTNLDAFVAPTQGADNAANSVAFINLVTNSIFSGVEVKLNNISVNSNFYTNPYIAYLQTILNYSPEALDSRLGLSGWYRFKS